VPPHYWIVLYGSSCKRKRKEVEDALGNQGTVVRIWSGRKKQDRCYALVAGAVEKIPKKMIIRKQPLLVEDDDDLDEDD
jgi:hypothetical protein